MTLGCLHFEENFNGSTQQIISIANTPSIINSPRSSKEGDTQIGEEPRQISDKVYTLLQKISPNKEELQAFQETDTPRFNPMKEKLSTFTQA